MPRAFRSRPIDEDFTAADRKDIAKELKAHVDEVAFAVHLSATPETERAPGHIVSHTLTGSFGPGDEYDPTRDPREVTKEAARMMGEEIGKSIVKQQSGA